VKRRTYLLLALAVVGLAVAGYLLFVGPRMYQQPHLRAFQAELPPMPPGVVPVADPLPKLPSAEEARTLANPVPDTAESRTRGKVYYEYYCVFCHGAKGDGNSPVGESYVPKPADLRTAKVRAYSDGQYLRAMLTGVGHDPVLERTVNPDHWWRLVRYAQVFTASPEPAR